MSRPVVNTLAMMPFCWAVAGCYDLSRSPFQGPVGDEEAVEWVEQIASSGEDSALIDLDLNGDIAVAGVFRGEATFGQGQDGEVTLSAGVEPQGGARAGGYLGRYRPSGEVLWVEGLAALGNVAVNDVSALADGNQVVVGSFEVTITFGAGGPNAKSLNTNGQQNTFLAWFDHLGELRWARRVSGSPSTGRALAADRLTGRLIAVGSFGGDATFNNDGSVSLQGLGGGKLQAFVAAFDDGWPVWVRQTHGEADAVDVVVAGERVYVAGSFRGTTTFGKGEANESTVTATGSEEVFVAAYDLMGGDLQWLITAAGNDEARPCALDMQGAEALVVAGTFAGTSTFGDIALTSTGDDEDLFIARLRLEPEASFHWAKAEGGAKRDGCADLSVRDDGSFILAGDFASDEIPFGDTTLHSGGASDGMVVGYDGDGAAQWARRLGGQGPRDSVNRVIFAHPDEAILSGRFDSTLTFGREDAGSPLADTGGNAGVNGFLLRLMTDLLDP